MIEESYEHWYDFGPGSEYLKRCAQEALQHSAQDTSGLIAVPREWRDEVIQRISKLEALVEAGREMADAIEWLCVCDKPEIDEALEKWRSLEGEHGVL